MLFEDGQQLLGFRDRAAGSHRLKFFEKQVDTARNAGCEGPAGSASDALKRVDTAARRKDRIACRGVNLPAVYFEPEFAVEDVPPLILVLMTMEGRPVQRHCLPLEHGEGPAGVAARDLDQNIIAEDVNRAATSVFCHECALDGTCSHASLSSTEKRVISAGNGSRLVLRWAQLDGLTGVRPVNFRAK